MTIYNVFIILKIFSLKNNSFSIIIPIIPVPFFAPACPLSIPSSSHSTFLLFLSSLLYPFSLYPFSPFLVMLNFILTCSLRILLTNSFASSDNGFLHIILANFIPGFISNGWNFVSFLTCSFC